MLEMMGDMVTVSEACVGHPDCIWNTTALLMLQAPNKP